MRYSPSIKVIFIEGVTFIYFIIVFLKVVSLLNILSVCSGCLGKMCGCGGL